MGFLPVDCPLRAPVKRFFAFRLASRVESRKEVNDGRSSGMYIGGGLLALIFIILLLIWIF